MPLLNWIVGDGVTDALTKLVSEVATLRDPITGLLNAGASFALGSQFAAVA